MAVLKCYCVYSVTDKHRKEVENLDRSYIAPEEDSSQL